MTEIQQLCKKQVLGLKSVVESVHTISIHQLNAWFKSGSDS